MAKAYKAKATAVYNFSLELDEMASKAGGMEFIAQQTGNKEAEEAAKELQVELLKQAYDYRVLTLSAKTNQEEIRAIDIDKVRNDNMAALKAVGTLFQ